MRKMNIFVLLGLLCFTNAAAESQGATMDDDFDYEAFKLALDELTEALNDWGPPLPNKRTINTVPFNVGEYGSPMMLR